MPLFIFLSGYVLHGKTINIRKKFNGLVIPYIGWYFITYAYSHLIGRNSESIIPAITKWIISPDYGLWYLWILYISICYLKIALSIKGKNKYSDLVILVFSWVILYKLPIDQYGLVLVKKLYPLFVFGYLTPKYFEQLIDNRVVSLISLLAFGYLGYFWNRIGQPGNWIYVSDKLPHISSYLLEAYKLIVPLSGITGIYGLISSNTKGLMAVVNKLGHQSLEIYVSHQLFIWPFGQSIILLTLSTLFSITSSLIIASILKKVTITNKLLYGNR